MLTRINYLYRDASNYKRQNEIYVNGVFTEAQKERIIASLYEGEYFIPCAIGWPETRISGDYDDDDHCWFELNKNDFCEVAEKPVWAEIIDRSPEQIVEDFESVATEWDLWQNEWWMNAGM